MISGQYRAIYRWGMGLLLAVALALVILWPAEDAEQRAATLIVAQSGEPRSLDPHTTTSSGDFRITENIFEGLVRFAPGSLQIEPSLAQSWEISNEGTTYLFELRRDVFFHDGTPFDAEAVAFNFERMLDPGHPYHHTGPFPLAFFFSGISGIEVLDSHRLAFHLEEPFAPFLANLAYPTGLIVSPSAVKEHDSAFARHPVGTGPFQFDQWESRRFVRLKAFEGYHRGTPEVPKVLFRPISDSAARVAELLSGSVDAVLEIPPDVLAALRKREGIRVEEKAGTHLWFIILNCRDGPFADPRMRKAVNLAVDRQAIADELLQGTADPTASAFPRAFDWIHSGTEAKPLPYNPEKARRIVEESGNQGVRLRLIIPEGGSGMLQARAMAEAIQADLAKVGLFLEIEVFEWNTYLSRVNAGLAEGVDMAAMAWMVNDPDTLPYLTLRSDAHPAEGGLNAGYFSDPDLDAALEEGRRAIDPDARARWYRKADQIIGERHPWLIVASEKQHVVTGADVQGIEIHPAFLLRLGQAKKATPQSP